MEYIKYSKIILSSLVAIYILIGLAAAVVDYRDNAGIRATCAQFSEARPEITEIDASVPPGVALPPTPQSPCKDFIGWGMITRFLSAVVFGPFKGLNDILMDWNAVKN